MSENGNGNGKWTAEQMIDALRATKGMAHMAARKLGCSHTTVYRYIDKYPTVRQAQEDESGKMGDMCELKLYDAAQRGESWAVQFALRTKFKQRGYTERTEITGADGSDLNMALKWAEDD